MENEHVDIAFRDVIEKPSKASIALEGEIHFLSPYIFLQRSRSLFRVWNHSEIIPRSGDSSVVARALRLWNKFNFQFSIFKLRMLGKGVDACWWLSVVVCAQDAIRTRLSSIFGAQSVAVLYYGDNEAHNKNVKKNLLCCFYCHKCWRINDAEREREKWGNRFISLLLAQHFYRIRTINWSMRLAKGWRVGSTIKWEIVHTKVNFPSLLQPLRVENFVCYNNKIFILLLASSRVCKKSLLSGFVLVLEANSYKVRGDMWGLENSTTLEQHRTQSVHCLTSLRRLEIFFLVFFFSFSCCWGCAL